MARKNAGGPNSLAVRDNTPIRNKSAESRQGTAAQLSNSNPHPGKQDTNHRTSHPSGGRTMSGGATLAVQGNANVRKDGFLNPPVHNNTPAVRKSYPTSPESPPTRGGRKVKGG